MASYVVAFCLAIVFTSVFAHDLASFFSGTKNSSRVTSEQYADMVASNVSAIRIGAGFAGVVAAAMITFLFASGFSFSRFRASSQSQDVATVEGLDARTLATMVDSVRDAAETIRSSRNITDEDRVVISNQLQELVRSSIPAEVLSGIDKKYGGAIRNEVVSSSVSQQLNETRMRLSKFQDDVSRKATAALVWGLGAAATGAGLLALFILNGNTMQGASTVAEVFYYTMRISLVGLIEVVAFFFLRQYRATLLDAKYVNNEITNIEMRLLAMSAALKLGNATACSKILPEIAKTERNFSLKKGETSIFHSASGSDMLPSNVVSDILGKVTAATRSGKE